MYGENSRARPSRRAVHRFQSDVRRDGTSGRLRYRNHAAFIAGCSRKEPSHLAENESPFMKVRIGISLGDGALDTASPDSVLEFIDDCERWDIDSVWVSDRIAAPRPTLDPVVFMAYLASRMRNMKFGTSALVLPTRHPVVLAKQLATLDFLCKGRLLLVVGIGGDDSRDFEAMAGREDERAIRGDGATVLVKNLWTQDHVDFQGPI